MPREKQGTGRAQNPAPSSDEAPLEKIKPAMEIRIGRVKAAIWLNHTETGSYYSVHLTRLYKDGDDQWRSSENFGRDDLLVVAKVADLAHTWIVNETQSETPF